MIDTTEMALKAFSDYSLQEKNADLIANCVQKIMRDVGRIIGSTPNALEGRNAPVFQDEETREFIETLGGIATCLQMEVPFSVQTSQSEGSQLVRGIAETLRTCREYVTSVTNRYPELRRVVDDSFQAEAMSILGSENPPKNIQRGNILQLIVATNIKNHRSLGHT